MDYEKKYKDALERAKEFYILCKKCGAKDTVDFLEDTFPELAESEGDRIRKEILEVAETVVSCDGTLYGKKYNCREWIAWLEKQGEKGTNGNEREIPNSEQKPADKVEPFDKYEGLTNFERTLADICIGWIGQELGWKQYIKDNADVLLKIAIKKLYSAQDVAFEQKPAELSQSEDTKTSDQVQKPAEWSDEDEAGLSDALWAIQQARAIAKDENDMGNLWYAENWLKHLKDRYVWKPSDEQLMELKCAICGCSFNIELLVSLEEQLKQL